MELTVPSVGLSLKVEIDDNFVPKLRMKVNQSFNFTLPKYINQALVNWIILIHHFAKSHRVPGIFLPGSS